MTFLSTDNTMIHLSAVGDKHNPTANKQAHKGLKPLTKGLRTNKNMFLYVYPFPGVDSGANSLCVCLKLFFYLGLGMYKPWQVSSSTWMKLSERTERLVLAVESPSETASEARSKEFYVLLQSSFLWSCAVASAPKGFVKHLPNR